METVIEVRLLGPLVLLVDGRPLELGKGNERLLVALLALNAGRSVSTETIIDSIWDECPPSSAREMVRIYVGRVRRRLGDLAIVTRGGGYALETEPDAVDALRFERLCKDASRLLEQGVASTAAAGFERALSLWSGSPLPELEPVAFVRDERARLEELRLTAIGERIDAELALGRAETVIAELESIVREHPYRERLRTQLMLALYRSGRQTEALDRYQEARRLLVEEFGVEPGPNLQALHKAILTHDPTLTIAKKKGTAVLAAVPNRFHRARQLATVTVIAALAVAIPSVVLETGGASSPTLKRLSLGAIDARSATVTESLHLGGLPGPLAHDRLHIWVGDGEHQTLRELDIGTLRTVRNLPLPTFPYRIVTGFGAVWVANGFDGRLVRVDPTTGATRVFRPEPRSSGRVQLASAFGSLWAASQDGILARLNPHTLKLQATIPGVGEPEVLEAGSGSLWLAEASRDELLRIDPRSNRIVIRIPIGGIAEGIASGGGAVWAVTPHERHIWRINPRNNAVTASIASEQRPTTVAVAAGEVWAGSADATLERIDTRRNQVVTTVKVGGPVAGLTSAQGRVWVTVR